MRTDGPVDRKIGPTYMDCNATTPLDTRVKDLMLDFMVDDFGNAGSRHEFGARANRAVQIARHQVAKVLDAEPHEVVFTSGATESCNLAVLGLAKYGETIGKRHIISTAIEHKAVLEPISHLSQTGFRTTLVRPSPAGYVEARSIAEEIRTDTLLVSVMQVNNETGVVQPIESIAAVLNEEFFHVDAAQGFTKDIEPLRNKRIDLISLSSHKIFGPKGVGALVLRKRGFTRPPLSPLMYGGGQERGIRPGTLPVHLIAGFGLAAELAQQELQERRTQCQRLKLELLEALMPLGIVLNGDQDRVLPHVLNLSIPGLDSEAVMLAVKDLLAISNGSACLSQRYEPSHVLTAMGLAEDTLRSALRFSWCHTTDSPDWDLVTQKIRKLL